MLKKMQKKLENYQHIAKSFGMAVMTISCKNLGASSKSQCSFWQPQPVIATSWPESRKSLHMDRTLNFDFYELRKDLGPDYVENISSRSLKKPLTKENRDCQVFTFQFLSDKIEK